MYLPHGLNTEIINSTDKTVTFRGVCPKCGSKNCGLPFTYAVKDYKTTKSFSKTYVCPNESAISGNTFKTEVYWTKIEQGTEGIDKSISTYYNKNAPVENIKSIEKRNSKDVDYSGTRIMIVYVDESNTSQSSMENKLKRYGDIAEKQIYEYKDGVKKYVYTVCIKEKVYGQATIDIEMFEKVYKIECKDLTGEEYFGVERQEEKEEISTQTTTQETAIITVTTKANAVLPTTFADLCRSYGEIINEPELYSQSISDTARVYQRTIKVPKDELESIVKSLKEVSYIAKVEY